MLNLYYNWKSYRVSQKNATYIVNEKWFDLIDRMFILEEVKENKEPRTFTIWFDEYEAIKKNTSILEKLREQIKDFMERYKTSDDTDIVVRVICRELLTSLETKEEPVPPTDKWREQYITDHQEELQPQFTPWQEIEVSNDEVWGWQPRSFICMTNGRYRCRELEDWNEYWKYARPVTIKEESPEIVVSDFDWLEIIEDCAEKSSGKEWEYDKYLIDALGDQVEALTRAVQQLSKANKK